MHVKVIDTNLFQRFVSADQDRFFLDMSEFILGKIAPASNSSFCVKVTCEAVLGRGFR